VLPDASLVAEHKAALEKYATAQAAAAAAGTAFAKDRSEAAKATLQNARAEEHTAMLAVGAANKALSEVPVLFAGTINAPFDLYESNPYVLLYTALKHDAKFTDFVDA